MEKKPSPKPSNSPNQPNPSPSHSLPRSAQAKPRGPATSSLPCGPHSAARVAFSPLGLPALCRAPPACAPCRLGPSCRRLAPAERLPRLAAPPGPLVRVAFLLPHPPRAQRKPPRSPPWLRQARIPEIPGLPFISPPTASLHPSTHTSPPLNPSRRLHSLRGSRASCPAAPALNRRTAVGPGPRSGSFPTPGTFTKSPTATPTRAAAGFHPRPHRR